MDDGDRRRPGLDQRGQAQRQFEADQRRSLREVAAAGWAIPPAKPPAARTLSIGGWARPG
jgi:hypothetical protein